MGGSRGALGSFSGNGGGPPALGLQVPSKDGDRLPFEQHAGKDKNHLHGAASFRGLKGGNAGLPEFRSPIGAQGAVGGPRHRILGDPHPGGEEPGDAIEPGLRAPGGDHGAPGFEVGEAGKIGGEAPDLGIRPHFHQIVKNIFSHKEGIGDPQGFQKALGGRTRLNFLGGEVQHDTPLFGGGGEFAAARMEPHRFPGAENAFFPQDVGGGQGGVAAEVHLHPGGEPAQAPSALFVQKKSRFR